ncbi:MAG: hypothetical protein OSA51_03930 [Octadecabacter sp.]|nr:hypothetical protein [Octadecabacter sp.]
MRTNLGTHCLFARAFEGGGKLLPHSDPNPDVDLKVDQKMLLFRSSGQITASG